MHLTPQELDKLVLHQAGFLAQKRLARGVRLNYPETVALIATQILEFIRDGRSVAELMDLGRRMLGRKQVMPGVPGMIHEVQVEGTFPDGTKLVTVHHPVSLPAGDLSLALYGSFLPVPKEETFGAIVDGTEEPGETMTEPGDLTMNEGRRVVSLPVTNLGDRPVQVGSHYPFIETNALLQFNRTASLGMRLDIPAGTAVRFEPGETKTVTLVELAGKKLIRGGNNLVDGPATADRIPEILRRIHAQQFANKPN